LLEDARIDRGEAAPQAGAIRIYAAVEGQHADRLVFLQAQGKPYRFECEILGERFAEGVGRVFSTVRRQVFFLLVNKKIGNVLWSLFKGKAAGPPLALLVARSVNPPRVGPPLLRAKDEPFGLFVPDEERGDLG